MRRLFSLLVALALLAAPSYVRAAPLTITADEIRAAIDTRLAQLWSAIQTKENQYYAVHGHYWQGLRTHTILPADGATALPDIGAMTPTDQPDSWPLTLRSTPIEMALVIDVYSGPLGEGYQASVWVMQAASGCGPHRWGRRHGGLRAGVKSRKG